MYVVCMYVVCMYVCMYVFHKLLGIPNTRAGGGEGVYDHKRQLSRTCEIDYDRIKYTN